MITISDEVERIKDIIIREYQPDKIILFGSRARGDFAPDSDIDILVVSDREKDLPRYKRGLQVRLKLASASPSTPLDILFYTHDDLNRFKNVKQSFCASVLREGVSLYG
jgi:predicted nucleotidyltransferase